MPATIPASDVTTDNKTNGLHKVEPPRDSEPRVVKSGIDEIGRTDRPRKSTRIRPETTGLRRVGEPRDHSIIDMVKDLRDDAMTLVKQEVALAKKEMTQKAAALGRNAVFIGIGALIGLYALFFVLLAFNNLIFTGLAAMGLSGTVANWLAPLLLGMMVGIVALALILKGQRAIRKAASPVPEKTVDTLREDRDWIKGKMK